MDKNRITRPTRPDERAKKRTSKATGVPAGVPRTLKLGMLKLGKLKLGMLGSAPQPERAAQLSTKAIARRIIIAPDASSVE
jgi:hypothetical protein